MGDPAAGPRRADESRDEVEVVVLDEQRRVRAAVELVDGRVGRTPVTAQYRAHGAREVGVGVVLELPQPVLDEPEHGFATTP